MALSYVGDDEDGFAVVSWGGTNYAIIPGTEDHFFAGYLFLALFLYSSSLGGNPDDFTVVDGNSNVYSAFVFPNAWTAGYNGFVCWGQIPTETDSITVTPASPLNSDAAYAGIEFWNGTGTITAVDQLNSASNADAPGSVTTLYSNEFVWTPSIGEATIPSGYTQGMVNAPDSAWSAGTLLPSPGAVNPTWGGTGDYIGVATFYTPGAMTVGDGGTAQSFFRRGTERKWAPWTVRKSGLVVPDRRLVFA